MMIGKSTLLQWLKEDMPYFDLTTHLLDIGDKSCRVEFYTRQEATVCGSEEVHVLFDEHGIEKVDYTPSGTQLAAGDTFFTAEGSFAAINEVVKVSQNIFEYASGISSRTQRMVARAKAVDPNVSVLTTRKVFPGTKELSLKAILAGGAYPHRLGLSDSILLFRQHIDFLGGFNKLENPLRAMRTKDAERKIIIEVDTMEEAATVQSLEIDGIQYDKFPTEELAKTVRMVKEQHPHLIHLAAGGINEDNIADYAATGVNSLVMTSAYFGKPVDIGVRFTEIE